MMRDTAPHRAQRNADRADRASDRRNKHRDDEQYHDEHHLLALATSLHL
jgi:hypothetical protein